MLTSRERVIASLNHKETDRTPVDFGGTTVTGIHAFALSKLRKAMNLEDRVIKVYEPMQMLGIIDDDIRAAIGSDVIGLYSQNTLLGFKNNRWKEWILPNKNKIYIGEGFESKVDKNGILYAYPGGNTNARPSAKMPTNGLYFDNITRQEDLKNHVFNAFKDYHDQYSLFSDEDCLYFEKESLRMFNETDYAVFGNFFLGGIGDLYHLPGAWLENPKGVRDIEEFLVSHYIRPDYIKDFFGMQTDIAIKNLELYRQAVGDRIAAIAVSGTDFGSQNGLIFSPDIYREFYKPFHKRMNEWVHKNTNWKVFFHSCGSVTEIIDDFIEAGVDILNPVQFNSKNMDLKTLKDRYGGKIVFWGGGIDPQKTLPFGSIEEVREETRNNVSIMSKGGGFICGTIHNIQDWTPSENIIAFFKAING
ncbi:MAG: uroporphyrinogen decarboxylase family protein [Candidatus Humimicrobiaceae bacterium]